MLAFHSHLAAAACPGPYACKACDGGTGADICTFTSTTVTCSFNDIAATQGAEGNFYNTSSTAFRGFGTDGIGEQFCCEYTGLVDACNDYTAPIVESFTGTNYADTIKLQYSSSHLGCADVVVDAMGGNDDILGSPLLALNYLEVLNGDGGNDTIRGEGGTDEIHGGDGNDTIWGGNDDDECYGDDGDDQIKGDDRSDYLEGGDDEDQVCGGDGSDVILGGAGDDLLFSGVGNIGIQTVTGGGDWDEVGTSTYAVLYDYDAIITSCPW